jgi:hypothetical protein
MYLDNFAEMSNQELIHAGTKQMDQTDQAIERSKMVISCIPFLFFGFKQKTEALLLR